MSESTPEYGMRDIQVGGVSATVIGEERARGKIDNILAVLAHGRTRSKKDSLKISKILMKSVPNLICVIFDLPNHGSRLTDPQANKTWDEGNVYHMIQMQAMIDQGAAEAVSLLQMIPVHLGGVKITQRVMIGVSLGGYITWKVAANHKELLTAAIPIITSPDLVSVMLRRWDLFKETNPDRASEIESTAIAPEILQSMQTNVKSASELRTSSLPIMAVCGEQDDLVPPEFTVKWGQQTYPCHRVELVPGVKHEVPPQVISLVADYLLNMVSHL